MLIFIYGDDTFQVQEKVQTMKAAFKEKFDPTGLNTAEFPLQDKTKLDPGEVLQAIKSLPFLGERRMVVIRDLVSNTKKADMSVWVDGLKSSPDSSIVIFWETTSPKALETKAIFKALKDEADVHHYPFPQLDGAKLGKWIATRIKGRGGSIGAQAQKALIERVGPDLWQMDHEISKLISFASGEQISLQMVDDLVHASFEGRIFDLIDAISRRQPKQALKLLDEERWSGANDHYLLTMLGRQVRILLGARALLDENPGATKQDLAGALSVHPFVAQKALQQARGFTMETLRSAHDLLFEFDQKLKTGQIDAKLAVDLTTTKLIQK